MEELSENNGLRKRSGSTFESTSSENSHTAVAAGEDNERKIKLDEDLVKLEYDLKLEPEEVKVKMEFEEDKDAVIVGEIASCESEEAEADLVQVRQETPGESNAPLETVGSRRRRVAYVEVPTLAEVKKRREGVKALGELLKPKVKKAEDKQFSFDTVYDRLKDIGLDPFPVDNIDIEKRDRSVPRLFLANVYGGSGQNTFPQTRKEKADEHGMPRYACMNWSLQPLAPMRPGVPGLFFDPVAISPQKMKAEVQEDAKPGADLLKLLGNVHQTVLAKQEKRRITTKAEQYNLEGWKNAGPLPTFTSISDSPVEWQYEGVYEYKPANPPYLTAQEWRYQSKKVKQKWGASIYHHKSWGSDICARIFGRKFLKRELTSQEQALVVNCGRHKDIDPDDVCKAFESGQEAMAIYTMKCIGYDASFQLSLCDKYAIWGKEGKAKNSGKKRKKVAEKAGRRGQSDSDDEDDDRDNEDQNSKLKSEDEHPFPKRRRTSLSPELGEVPSKARNTNSTATRQRGKGSRAHPITLD